MTQRTWTSALLTISLLVALGLPGALAAAMAPVGPLPSGDPAALAIARPLTYSLGGGWTASGEDFAMSSSRALTGTIMSVPYAVLVSPAAAALQGDPGTVVTYTLEAVNIGDNLDAYTVSVSGDEWPASAPASVGPLLTGELAEFVVTVTVPLTATCTDADEIVVTLTSQADANVSDSSTLTTSGSPVPGMTVAPASDALSGDPGETVTYTLRVTNTGNCADTFAVAVSGDTWATSTPASVGPVASGAGADIQVAVTVPSTAPCGSEDEIVVTLTSQEDGTVSGSSTLTTSANTVRGVSVAPASAALPGDPGETVTYTLRVTNTGNCADTFTVGVNGDAWPTSAPTSVGPLAAGAGVDVQVAVTVPAAAQCTDADEIVVTLTSQADGTATGSSTLTTSAGAVAGVTVTPASAALSGDPGETVAYTLRVTNTGNCADTFTVGVSGDVWATSTPASVGPLASGAGADVQVAVTVPSTAQCSDADEIVVTLTSQADGMATDSSTLTTSANTVRGVTVAPASAALSDAPGETVTYTLRVTNTGNCADTFTVGVNGNAWPTSAPASVGPLGRGAGADVQVAVTIPLGSECVDQDVTTVVFTSQADGSATDSSTLTTSAGAVAGVTVTPVSGTLSGDPGQTVAYTLRVTNTGTCTDTFTVGVSGDAWTAIVPSSVGPLGPGVGADVEVMVTVPSAAQCVDSDAITVAFTSQRNGSVTDSSTLTTWANAVGGVIAAPTLSNQSGAPGTTVTYTLRVTNTGNCADTVLVGYASPHGWIATVPSTVGPLAPGQGANVQVAIQIPFGTADGTLDTATVTWTSQNDGAIRATTSLRTTAHIPCEPVSGVGLSYAPSVPRMGETIVLTASVSAGDLPITFAWDLGDGSAVQMGAVIEHTFPRTLVAQSYTVILTASNGCPSQDVAYKAITMLPQLYYMPVAFRQHTPVR
jgi:uncharacterized membrane protein